MIKYKQSTHKHTSTHTQTHKHAQTNTQTHKHTHKQTHTGTLKGRTLVEQIISKDAVSIMSLLLKRYPDVMEKLVTLNTIYSAARSSLMTAGKQTNMHTQTNTHTCTHTHTHTCTTREHA